MSEMGRTNKEWHQAIRLLRSPAIGAISEVLSAGVAAGGSDPGPDVQLASAALSGMRLVVAVDWLAFLPGRPLEDVLAGPRSVVASRLRPVPPRGDTVG